MARCCRAGDICGLTTYIEDVVDAMELGGGGNVDQNTIQGRISAGTGSVEELTAAQGRTVLGLGSAALASTADFAADIHNHNAADITAGTIATARLGSGSASNTTFLRGDQTWATVSGGGLADGDYGDVTVSGTGATITIDNGVVSYAKIQNVSATDKLLGRSSAGAGVIEEIACTSFARTLLDDSSATVARATLELGSAALSSAGDFAADIHNHNAADITAGTLDAARIGSSTITYAKIQNVSATDKLLGRSTAGAGVIEEITCTAFGRSLIDDADATAARTTLGLGSAATTSASDYALDIHSHNASDITAGTVATARLGSGTANTAAFLRGDQSWSNTIAGPIVTEGYQVSSGAIIADATTSRTLSGSDNGKTIVFSSNSAITVTVPTGLGAGFSCSFIQAGTGAITFSASSTTINSYTNLLSTAGQHAAASLLATAANVFNLSGALA